MKPGRNRPERKDHAGVERPDGRPRRRGGCAALLVLLAALALAAPVQARTGGASTVASSAAQAGSGLAFTAMRTAGATWYGPGFYGSRTACGQVLRPRLVGVAHRRLPCGTPVKFAYHGRQIVTRVVDRGPYAKGKSWDLTNGARRALRFNGSDRVRYAVAIKYARR